MTSFGGGYKGRLEDERMLKGRGRYVSDWNLPLYPPPNEVMA